MTLTLQHVSIEAQTTAFSEPGGCWGSSLRGCRWPRRWRTTRRRCRPTWSGSWVRVASRSGPWAASRSSAPTWTTAAAAGQEAGWTTTSWKLKTIQEVKISERRYRFHSLLKIIHHQRGLHSTEVAYLLLTQQPQNWFSAFPRIFLSMLLRFLTALLNTVDRGLVMLIKPN